MRVIPVLDLMAGLVVRGVGGRREEYRPLVSALTPSSRPVDVARAIHEHFGLCEFYLADLDALAGAPPDLGTYAALRDAGFQFWVDAGLREAADAIPLAAAGVDIFIAGLETLHGPRALAELVCRFGSNRVVFSLDLKNGQPLGDLTRWTSRAPFFLAAEAVAAGVEQLVLLDLARVGTGGGVGTIALCDQIAAAYPQLKVIVGGGVRGVEDLQELARRGIHAALLASALHDGRLRREDLRFR